VATAALGCEFTPQAADATPDAAPDATPPPAVGSTTVAGASLTVDLASPRDGAIAPDGQNDGVFDVQVTGPMIALTLIRTDAAGMPTSSQQWDTWVGADVIPGELGTIYVAGSSTYQLGVYDAAGVLLNDANGRLAVPAGQHAVRVAGSNVGSFVAGSHFLVVGERLDGVLVRGPVVAY